MFAHFSRQQHRRCRRLRSTTSPPQLENHWSESALPSTISIVVLPIGILWMLLTSSMTSYLVIINRRKVKNSLKRSKILVWNTKYTELLCFTCGWIIMLLLRTSVIWKSGWVVVLVVSRVVIRHDRRDRWLCKFFANWVILFQKTTRFLQNMWIPIRA